MRKFIVAVTMSIFFVTGFAPMADASPTNLVNGSYRAVTVGSDIVPVDHYYGHRRKYKKKHYYQEERCWWKKVRRYDEYGDVYYERIRICK